MPPTSRPAGSLGAIVYLLGVFVVLLAPVAEYGVTPAVVAAQQFSVGGAFPEQPHRALAFGVLYFGLISLWEILGRGFVIRRAGRGW